MRSHSPPIHLAAVPPPPPAQSPPPHQAPVPAIAAVFRDDENSGSEILMDLCHRMRSGDEPAFTEFYDRYYDRLFRYLLLLTRGNELATRDLVQIALTKAMRNIRVFTSQSQLWNWLAAIARNSFIDSMRRSRAAPEIVSLLPDDNSVGTALPEQAEERLMSILDECLAQIETDERALIEAYYFNDTSQRSMAERHGTTAKAIESKLARVRKKLRAAFLRRLTHEND